MPSSHFHQLSTILELIIYTNPQSILDIGVGFGKYGLLAREYLEIWGPNSTLNQWERKIDGIEAFEDYLTPTHSYIYDQIFIGDAREILGGLNSDYDLILLIAVLEYLDHASGIELIENCLRVSRNILISTDKSLRPTTNPFGNPFEAKKFLWEKRQFAFPTNRFFVADPIGDTLICFSGTDLPQVKKAYKWTKVKSRVNMFLPFIHGLRKIRNRSAKR